MKQIQQKIKRIHKLYESIYVRQKPHKVRHLNALPLKIKCLLGLSTRLVEMIQKKGSFRSSSKLGHNFLEVIFSDVVM